MVNDNLLSFRPETPSPVPVIAAAIEKITQLQGLPLEEREWLATHGQELRVGSGEVLFDEGQPAELLLLILKGEVHVRRMRSGSMTLFIGRSGQMTGLLPFSRMTSYGGQGYAVGDVWGLVFHKSLFPQMLTSIPSFGQRVVSTLLDRVREVTRIEQQSEKLTALGKLAGNLAHELNNPSSAAQRAASGILTELRSFSDGRYDLISLCLSPEQVLRVQNWERDVRARALESVRRDQIDVATREDAIAAWMQTHNITGGWQIAPELAELGIEAEDLEALSTFLDEKAIHVVLEQFASALRAEHFAQAMISSTDRIFDLISAIKTYSYMDRAPILEVDVEAGLDATVQMLQSRMGRVNVVRDYELGLPTISAYGSELNQVWTAIIENALDAIALNDARTLDSGDIDSEAAPDEKSKPGCLRLVCRQEPEMMLVEVWDNGPGIPPELRDRIFEPFYTTKPPGQGLGLGLDNAMRIVRKHRGQLGVRSEGNSTCFWVRLPLNQLQAY